MYASHLLLLGDSCSRMWRRRVLPLMLCFIMPFLSSCAQQIGQLPSSLGEELEGEGVSQGYLLASEDVVEVMVWKNPDLSRMVTVRPDGKISLPLIGDVQAAGFTASQLAEEIAGKLKTYYQEPPEVSVIVEQINSYAIYILGGVNNPGKHVVKTETTFLQAIALGEGFSVLAAPNKIVIRRKTNSGKEVTIRMPYKDVIAGTLKDVVLQPGDILIVP